MSNLFSALHKYSGTQKENSVTEIFAQVLNHNPSFCKQLFYNWTGLEPPDSIQVYTQWGGRVIDDMLRSNIKFIDLAIFDMGSEVPKLTCVIEIKWWASQTWSLDEKGQYVPQTALYENIIEKYPYRHTTVPKIYLTRIISNEPRGWKAKRWVDVYVEALRYLKITAENQLFGTELIKAFIVFLEEQGVEEKHIVAEDLAHIGSSIEVYQKVERLFAQLSMEIKNRFQINLDAKVWQGSAGSQIARFGRYATYWNHKGTTLNIVFGFYPNNQSFHNAIDPTGDFVTGVPVVTTWVEAKPNSPESIRIIGSEILGRVSQVQGWRNVVTPNSNVILHKSASLIDIPKADGNVTDSFTTRAIEYFCSAIGELKANGFNEYLSGA